jgi:hypothetical protein
MMDEPITPINIKPTKTITTPINGSIYGFTLNCITSMIEPTFITTLKITQTVIPMGTMNRAPCKK